MSPLNCKVNGDRGSSIDPAPPRETGSPGPTTESLTLRTIGNNLVRNFHPAIVNHFSFLNHRKDYPTRGRPAGSGRFVAFTRRRITDSSKIRLRRTLRHQDVARRGRFYLTKPSGMSSRGHSDGQEELIGTFTISRHGVCIEKSLFKASKFIITCPCSLLTQSYVGRCGIEDVKQYNNN